MKTKLFLICSVFLFSGFSFAKKLDKKKVCIKLVKDIEHAVFRGIGGTTVQRRSIIIHNLTNTYNILRCDKLSTKEF